MRSFLYSEVTGFVEKDHWLPNSWIKVETPTQDDILYLTEELKVPESFIADIEDTDERPRVEHEGNWLLTILRIPIVENGKSIPYTTVPIGIMTNDDVIVTLCYYRTDVVKDFILHTRRKGVLIRNKYELIMRLIHSSAVWFLKYLKKINNEVTDAENALAKSIRNEDLLHLMNLQKSLVYFNTSIRGNEVMFNKLQSIFQEPAFRIDSELLEDVDTELKQAHNTVNIYSDILTGTMDAFASVISNNVNTIMKRMTSISIILMVPTLIASFYGMNIINYAEELPYGFIVIIIASLFFSAMAFYIFKKIKWF
ncbi:magnesium transporter [Parabacteroides sp. PF5-5]|uniref:magnesium transporter CorA family protein n=1 Tax=unclassified Parabacteroides TaxID=2649774 RepID=UPI002476DAB8|nr:MULTISPECIES: magnesium transporter CorA family protein [unclassified Parabacteroides]MDH6303814.1 magnesium transporter [Parabacteroides sp. PH5-39]MDH6314431.1 magnesium transporter [Parabacteroides sp. PF5-13]MDH6318504.1 magnesium transporter [Parabacteroides sp. PH5-13]MDH6322203.1 magnesium transporter [Parabacteroides sp. PH5-8]MDH6325717.1 magnesium transporter [Parabacteroides sp. PH5-41]